MDNDTATWREWAGLAVLALPTLAPRRAGGAAPPAAVTDQAAPASDTAPTSDTAAAGDTAPEGAQAGLR